MRQTEQEGRTLWRCAFCLTDYPSRAAARECEDEHLDEKSTRRQHHHAKHRRR